MNSQTKDIVDLNFYNIEEEQFLRILARVTTTVVNTHLKQHSSVKDIYKHVVLKLVPGLIYMCQV